jgi:hypothetical protein
MVVDRQKRSKSDQEVHSGRQARGQDRQNGQAGVYRVQKQARVKTGRTRKRRRMGKTRWLTWQNIQDELAQKDRKQG